MKGTKGARLKARKKAAAPERCQHTIDIEEAIARAPGPVIWGYARVSREDQELALQLDALAAYGVKPEHVVSEKASGARDDRPGFRALVDRLRSKDSLVVWKIDRLGRDAVSLIRTANLLEERGVRLVVTTLGIDTATPAGRLVYGIMAQIAQAERETLIERTKAGLEATKRRGTILGRRRTLTPYQREEARRMIAEGHSYGDVAKHFNVSRSVAWRSVNDASLPREPREAA